MARTPLVESLAAHDEVHHRASTASESVIAYRVAPFSSTSCSVGQSFQISAPCYGEAGIIRLAFTRRFNDGHLRGTSVNRGITVGREIPLPTPSAQLKAEQPLSMPFDLCSACSPPPG
jgi:hypothetical protein